MYSISSVNEGKYKILSCALVGVFNDTERTMKPIPIGEQRPVSIKPAEPLVKESEQTDAGIGQLPMTRCRPLPVTCVTRSVT